MGKSQIIIFLIVICLLAFAHTTQAQYWNSTGGVGGPSSGAWLGTNNNNPLDIRTNTVNRLYISTSGQVGINTITPSATLDINGLNSSLATRLFTVHFSSGAGTALNNTEFSALAHLGPSVIGGTGFTALYAKGGSNSGTAAGFFDGKVVVANGSLGIGTNAPIQALDVNGRINVASGVIQRGGSAISNTVDLGLYSLESGFHMRFVTNNAPIRFFSDGGTNPAGGTDLFTIAPNGNVGVGAGAPEDKFQVNSQMAKIVIGAAYGPGLAYGTGYIGFNASRQNSATWSTSTDGANNGAGIIYSDVAGNILFSNIPSTGATGQVNVPDATIVNNTALFVGASGGVGIGTRNTLGYKLAVNGFVRAKKVVVETGWSDFVFYKNYHLRSLKEVEKHINEHGYLPEVPSAKEIETNGADVGELLKLQMQKIEELTLYIIEQNKRIEALENRTNNNK